MSAQYIPLDSDCVQDNSGPHSENFKASNKYRRLASILSVILTAVTVALIVVITQANFTNDAPPRTKPTTTPATTKHPVPCMSNECVSASGIASYMDLTANPCTDFYKFTCGKWEDDHPLPAGGVDGWSPFVKLTYEARKYMKQALESLNKTEGPKAFEKLINFYHGCINKTSRNLTGYSQLMSKIRDIGGWPTIDMNWTPDNYSLEHSLIESIKLKHFPLIRIQVIKDWMSNNETIISIGPNINPESGFTSIFEDKKPRSNFEYFVINDKDKGKSASENLFFNLVYELNNLFTGYKTIEINKTIENDYNNLNNLYKNLANLSSPPFSINYYMENYQTLLKVKVKDLTKTFSGIDYHKILKTLFDVKNDTKVFIQDIEYLHKLGDLINKTNKRIIANYIGSSFVKRFGPFTTTKMVELLVDKLDSPEVLPYICYDLVETYLPNLLGRLYVDKRFNNKSIDDMQRIIDLIQLSFYKSLSQSNWMDSETKKEAIQKVQQIKKNIAFPKWTANNTELDAYYDPANVSIDDFFSSVLNVVQLSQNFSFMQLKNENLENESGPRVNDSWPSHDATYVNAFYYFTTNGIYFPAGIAQDPFYVYNRPTAMNLGSIGMIIGHEMTHSLDTQGSLYDHEGNLRDWWKDSTRKTFLNKSQCFIDQYSAIRFPEYKTNVNGNRTLSENIADNGGLRRAYEALELYKKIRPKNEAFKPLPGLMSNFTEEQLFFISFANMWCSNMFPKAVNNTLQNGSHSPESVRVFGTLANFDKFTDAFHCKDNDKMNPKKKCILW